MRLNDEQRSAVEHDDSTVVLAGPGSGKTQTLVNKVAHLLDDVVQESCGVACITYNNDAVAEFTVRLRQEGLRPGRRLFLGTVHSFCLTRVIRPYAHLIGFQAIRDSTVSTASQQLTLRQRALDMLGVNEQAQWFDTTLNNIRKDLACGDDLSRYDPRHIEVARQFELLLKEHALIDFDAMTFEALRIIEQHPAIANLIVSRYPWFAVDEYQDLGGVLHRIVMALHAEGAKIFAVGDPDQCVYEFAGARPSTINSLVDSEDFHSIRLRYNYRSGTRLIATAQAALGEIRDHVPSPDRSDPGQVVFQLCDPGLSSHARFIVRETIPMLVSDGIPLHEIAILYPGKGPLLDEIRLELDGSDISYRFERDDRFPNALVIRWLQRCGAFVLRAQDTGNESLTALADGLLFFVAEAGRLYDQNELQLKKQLFIALDEAADSEDPLEPWLRRLTDELGLERLLDLAGKPDEVEALANILSPGDTAQVGGPTLAEFAGGAVVEGRVVLTTYHSSKSRQFEVVLLPGLQDTLVPRARWNRQNRSMETENMSAERRLFYVALSRSRSLIVLYYSDSFQNKNGYPVRGRSIFVDEIETRLAMEP